MNPRAELFLKRAFRGFELLVALALLAVLIELLLIHVNRPAEHPEVRFIQRPAPVSAASVSNEAPLQVAGKPAPARPPVQPPPAEVCAPAVPPARGPRPARSDPPPLLSFYNLRNEINQFFNSAPLPPIPDDTNLVTGGAAVLPAGSGFTPPSPTNFVNQTNAVIVPPAPPQTNQEPEETNGVATTTSNNSRRPPGTTPRPPPARGDTNDTFRLAFP